MLETTKKEKVMLHQPRHTIRKINTQASFSSMHQAPQIQIQFDPAKSGSIQFCSDLGV